MMKKDQNVRKKCKLMTYHLSLPLTLPINLYSFLSAPPLKASATFSVGKRKIKDVATRFSKVVAVACNQSLELDSNSECDNCSRLMQLVREKLRYTPTKDKIVELLTLVPDD